MNVPDDLQAQVRAVVTASVEHVLLAYPSLVLPPILITYERSYTTAGWAKCLLYQVNFDPILLVANQEEFLKQIVPHEVAHIITEHIHGHKVQAHGDEWKAIMVLMGLEPLRCHTLDTSISKRKFTTYKFICGCTDEVHEYASVMSRKILLEKYVCTICQKRLLPATPIVIPTSMPRRIALGTKQDKAKWIIRHNRGKERKVIIKKLIEDAGLTPAGAATYYYNLQNKR